MLRGIARYLLAAFALTSCVALAVDGATMPASNPAAAQSSVASATSTAGPALQPATMPAQPAAGGAPSTAVNAGVVGGGGGVTYDANAYVPHSTYPYADTYGTQPTYDGYLVPAGSMYGSGPPAGVEYSGGAMSSFLPKAQSALQVTLRVLARTGLFLLGGVALLVVGGLFTTAVCSLTPLCTLTFHGLRGVAKDTVRSLVTGDNLSAAAGFVQDAVHNYQRIQRAVGGPY